MEPAVEPFREIVEATDVRQPRVPVLSCVTAEPFDDVRERLVEAITRPVRWLEVMQGLEQRGRLALRGDGPRQGAHGPGAQVPGRRRRRGPAAHGARPCVAPSSRARPPASVVPEPRTRTAALASVAMAVPEQVIGNEVIAEGAGVTEQWIVAPHRCARAPPRQRGRAPGDLALAAGREALDGRGPDSRPTWTS